MMWLMKIFSKGNKKRAGFTLVELMIVVIVVGILAAAAIPIYQRSMDKAYASEGKALLGTIRTHYITEVAAGVTVTFSDLATWGIDTSKNKWWTTEAADFTTGWASSVFTITGLVDPIDAIQLAINCDDGEFTIENYNYSAS